MAAFMGEELGFRVVYLFVPKILAKKAILAAHWAQFGHFRICTRLGPQTTSMATFMGVKHGFRIVSLFVSKIIWASWNLKGGSRIYVGTG